jgi:hypothetical protein
MPNTPVTLPPAEFDRLRAEYEADGEVMPDHYIRAIPTEERGYELWTKESAGDTDRGERIHGGSRYCFKRSVVAGEC